MVRRLVLIVSWPTLRRSLMGIFRRVKLVSQKLFAMVVGRTKEEHGETIIDDR